MQTKSLDQGWVFLAPAGRGWLPARVPGCVHTDLLHHGLIAPPFEGCNELALQWIEEADWDYRCSFDVEPALLACENVALLLDGLDTVASVQLNGQVLLHSDNMFHGHRLPVKALLKPAGNLLEIRFDSALAHVRTVRSDFVVDESNDPVGGRYRIRKQQCQFGWDWGPRFVTAGVWRPVRLQAWSGNRLADVSVAQQHGADGSVTLQLQPQLEQDDGAARFSVSVRLNGQTVAACHDRPAGALRLEIPEPQLWWPAGQGEQPLYDVEVTLLGAAPQRWQARIGLRTITLDQDRDGLGLADGEQPHRFGLRVNGRLIFAKGANWIPAHSFVAGLGRADYEPLLRDARAAHMNMLRVWGGGIYEHDAFYALCDELGLLVWQDLMFACCLYPADAEFLSSVRREVAEQAARLRHHACLALWCGENELAMINGKALAAQPERRAEYLRLFTEAIPQALAEADPGRPYLHASPALPLPVEPGPTLLPSHDAHDWEVWHQRKPVEHYEGTRHRFVSEFGMQSYPSLPVARSFCPPEQLDIGSPVFQNHQKNNGGNATILDYSLRLYRLPGDYGGQAYISQLNQAWCMKVAVEHFRRSQPYTLGALYWQLNDCWPVASWSSIEHGGRWKALHFAARRFFAPALVCARHLGQETATIGNYTANTKGEVELWTCYDGPEPQAATLQWTLLSLDGRVLLAGSKPVALQPLVSRCEQQLDCRAALAALGPEGQRQAVLRLQLLGADAAPLSENTVFFAAPRLMDLAGGQVDIETRADGPGRWTLALSSPRFEHAVSLEFDEPGALLSENCLDLYPGQVRLLHLTVPSGPLPAWRLRTAGQP